MEFLVLLIIIILLVIDWLISKEFYKIAVEKGFDNEKYLWITFLLGIVGMIMVCALPDRRGEINYNKSLKNDVNDDELPEL